MPSAGLLVLTGPPGAGKTTVSRLLAGRSETPSCVLESDWWWTTLVNGHVPPWLPEAHEQNRTLVRSFSAAACVLAAGGYRTVLEGIVGPWMLDLVLAEAAARDVDVHYVVLRPARQAAVQRATSRAGQERVPGHPALTDEGVLRQMWDAFADLGPYETHALDNTHLDAEQTADAVWALVEQGVALPDPGLLGP